MPHLLLHGTSVFEFSSEEPLQVAASNNRQSGFRTYSIPNPDRTLYIVTHLMHEFLCVVTRSKTYILTCIQQTFRCSVTCQTFLCRKTKAILMCCLLFYVPLDNISFTLRLHNCRWRLQYVGLGSAPIALVQEESS